MVLLMLGRIVGGGVLVALVDRGENLINRGFIGVALMLRLGVRVY
jgi:hypothetical protein